MEELGGVFSEFTDRMDAVFSRFIAEESSTLDRSEHATESTFSAFADRLGSVFNKSPAYPTVDFNITAPPNQKTQDQGSGGSQKGGGDSGITGLVGQLTDEILSPLKSAIGGVTDFAGKLLPFVAAFSPAAVMLFNDALTNVMATIGVALEPALNVLTDVLRQMAGVLDPLARELAPIFAQLANIVGGVLLPLLRLFASVIEALMPVIQVVADLLQGLGQVLHTVVDVFTAIVRTLGALVGGGGGFKEAVDEFVKLIRELIASLVRLVAMIAKFFLFESFVAELADQFKKLAEETEKEATARNAAAKSSATENLESILKRATQAAFIANGSGADERDKDKESVEWLKRIHGELEKIDKGKAVTINPKTWVDRGDTHTTFLDRSTERGAKLRSGEYSLVGAVGRQAWDSVATFAEWVFG